jgi:hypothetical protein
MTDGEGGFPFSATPGPMIPGQAIAAPMGSEEASEGVDVVPDGRGFDPFGEFAGTLTGEPAALEETDSVAFDGDPVVGELGRGGDGVGIVSVESTLPDASRSFMVPCTP